MSRARNLQPGIPDAGASGISSVAEGLGVAGDDNRLFKATRCLQGLKVKWRAEIGPGFIVTVGVLLLTALGWFTDGRSTMLWTERVVRLETQMIQVLQLGEKIDKKLDGLKNGR